MSKSNIIYSDKFHERDHETSRHKYHAGSMEVHYWSDDALSGHIVNLLNVYTEEEISKAIESVTGRRLIKKRVKKIA